MSDESLSEPTCAICGKPRDHEHSPWEVFGYGLKLAYAGDEPVGVSLGWLPPPRKVKP